MITTELTRKDWALGIAEAVSLASECTRRKVGAIILDTRHRIIGAGYNGTRSGDSLSCARGDCPRGRHYKTTPGQDFNNDGTYRMRDRCGCGGWWPCGDAVEPGSSYDTGKGACIASHAELNAVMDVDNRRRMDGATLYVTSAPCDGCIKIINNATRIAAIVWKEGVRKF